MLNRLRSSVDELKSFAQRLETNVSLLRDEDQFLFANALALRSAGLVEQTAFLTLEEYTRARSNGTLARFVGRKVEWMNSFDCEKIKKLLDEFDDAWWSEISKKVGSDCLEAIDSLKAIRDKVAHGKHNGTGFKIVKGYHKAILKLPPIMSKTILGY